MPTLYGNHVMCYKDGTCASGKFRVALSQIVISYVPASTHLFWDEVTYTGNDINSSFSTISKTNHRNFLKNTKETKGSGSLGMCQTLHFAVLLVLSQNKSSQLANNGWDFNVKKIHGVQLYVPQLLGQECQLPEILCDKIRSQSNTQIFSQTFI